MPESAAPPESGLARELRRLVVALGYFTRIPVPSRIGGSAAELNRAARYFPFVGLLVGAIAAVTFIAAGRVLPLSLAVVVSMAASLVLTGAFHEDGLADTVDGFGGGWDKAQVLAIMKDSRIGAYGAIALVLALLAKYASLIEIAADGVNAVALALLVAHPLSRAAALGIMAALPYVRVEGEARARPVAKGLGPAEWVTGIALGAAPLAFATSLGFMSPARTGAALIMAVIVAVVCANYFRRRIGGYTGDCLGATQQLCELGLYAALLARV